MPRRSLPTTAPMDERLMPYESRRRAPARRSSMEESILAATEQLLAGVALSDLSVEQILREAGISRTTFYRFFRSKYLVVSSLLERAQSDLVQVMQPWFSGEEDRADGLARAIRSVADSWAQHRTVLRAASEHWHSEPEVGRPWAAMMNRFVADIARQIDAERRKGLAPDGIDSTDVARTLVWGSERMLYLAGFGLCGEGLEHAVVEPLIAMWRGMIYHA